MSEFIFAIGLALGFAIGIFVGWQNAKFKYKDVKCVKQVVEDGQ